VHPILRVTQLRATRRRSESAYIRQVNFTAVWMKNMRKTIQTSVQAYAGTGGCNNTNDVN